MMMYDSAYFNLYIDKFSASGSGEDVYAMEHLPQGKIVGYFTGTIILEDISTQTNIGNETKFGFPALEVEFGRLNRYQWRAE